MKQFYRILLVRNLEKLAKNRQVGIICHVNVKRNQETGNKQYVQCKRCGTIMKTSKCRKCSTAEVLVTATNGETYVLTDALQ